MSNVSPLAVVTGGSAGLGKVIAKALLARGYHVVIVGRSESRLAEARNELEAVGDPASLSTFAADLTSEEQVARLRAWLQERSDRLDVLVNVAGASDRGLVEKLTRERLIELIDLNVTTALLCSQQLLPMLREARGVIVNIGSLASKVGARYLGGYAPAKHALAGLTQQLRLELRPEGVHVALVCPGPIRRQDAGKRYTERVDRELPEQAAAPGGGAKLKGLAPERVVGGVIRCIERRCPEVILPAHLRLFVAIGHASPRLGDWLLLKFTSGPDS